MIGSLDHDLPRATAPDDERPRGLVRSIDRRRKSPRDVCRWSQGVSKIATSTARTVRSSVRPGETEATIPMRSLGRTGERVSAIGLGGFHLGKPDLPEAESVRIVRTAIDAGVNFLDNSWDYNEGRSEIRMGKALRDGYRERAFLMTKIDGQTRAAATRQIEESLGRLQTDVIDLLQFHEIIRMEDPDRIFAKGGAIAAALEAKDAGKIRYLGFTGHKNPAIHLQMLETAAEHGFRFDTVQMPLNVMDAHFESFVKRVVPVLVKEGIGVLGMKPLGDRQILEALGIRYTAPGPLIAAMFRLGMIPRTEALRHVEKLGAFISEEEHSEAKRAIEEE